MKDWKFLFRKYVLRKGRPWAEPKVAKALLNLHGSLFVDIGTNRKFYAKLLKGNFDRIITVDPNPKWDADLKIAISDFDGNAEFNIQTNDGSADSLIKKPLILGEVWDVPLSIVKEPFQVTVKRFDSLDLDADLVKIDVEGSEFEVLGGMEKHLPKNVLVELHDEDRRIELEGVLESKFRNLRWIDNTHILASLPKK